MMSGLRKHKAAPHTGNNLRCITCMYFHFSAQEGAVTNALLSIVTLLS